VTRPLNFSNHESYERVSLCLQVLSV